MNTKDFLNNINNQIRYKPVRKFITEEIEEHINELKSENIANGLSVEQAEENAIKQMGNPTQIGKILNKIHKPKNNWVVLILTCLLIAISGHYNTLLFVDVFGGSGFIGLNDFMTNKLEYIIYILVLLTCVLVYFSDYKKIYSYSKLFYILATILNIIACIRGERINGNVVWGLWPITSVSPTVFSVPLYLVAYVGFIQEVKERKSNIKTVLAIALSCLSLITSLMVNFVSGFLLAVVYIVLVILELLMNNKYKTAIMCIITSILLFAMLSIVIYILPTKKINTTEGLSSSLWGKIKNTYEEQEFNFERNETLESAKLLGHATIKGATLSGSILDIETYFNTTGLFAILGILTNYGWIITIALILLLTFFNFSLFISAIKVKDSYGKLILIAFACLYTIQTICNLAMNFGVISPAEFNLPFISDGKVGFLINLLCLSLILSIYRRKDINYF